MEKHLCVCICTYKRPQLLTRALNYIENQTTEGKFTFSIVVVDNDATGSAKEVVSKVKTDLVYDIEPEQNIALARNRAVKNARGDFFVFMDDDEFPSENWLLNLYLTQNAFQSAGVLGPVKPFFEGTPPKWLISSGICERPDFKTGTVLSPRFTRTGNVLIRSDIFSKNENFFNPEFGRVGGEDSDFFRRVIAQGHQFVWCGEAVVFETVPRQRWKRSFYIKRALLRGRSNAIHDKYLPFNKKTKRILHSLVAFLGYSVIFPFMVMSGEKVRMKFLERYFHHTGRLLTSCGIQIVTEREDAMSSKYVVITPARNEELYIEKTIISMVNQTIKPVRWIIVSDGSTDRTDEIVKKYIPQNKWIELLRMPEHRERQFAAKVHCFNAGYNLLRNDDYDFICNCDADISFEPDYFEFLLSKFNQSPSLGVAGTPFVEENYIAYDGKFTNFNHVSGACQMFRKECYHQIGGYIPIKGGGIDWAAVTTARMMGWKTQTFPEKHFFHHRKMGTGASTFLQARFNHGKKDYYLGGHPLWEIFRGVYQMMHPPYVLAGAYMMAGYFYGMVKKIERPLPVELMRFHRKEQLDRLKSIFFSVFRIKKR